jgi:diadenylate cyclase
MAALLEQLVSRLTLRDTLVAVADIVIVYYLIYRVLLLIKGTRAAQMLIGLFLIGVSFFAAKQFELTTLSWLLDNFINYFIIVIIVVFQHDIRRGLMRMGTLFSSRRKYQETFVFEEVIRAAEQMARARIGGLIVFEREADLSEFIEAGVALDAQVSQELLVSLFLPESHNVCHDGAAIIKNLRVQQAGAVLPLSANPKLDKQLGTRHRAAIGITEETDAVVVVVSEERGQVSLCFHGNIARDLSGATLRKALLGLFQKERRGGAGYRRRKPEEEAEEAAAAGGGGTEAEAATAAAAAVAQDVEEAGPPGAPDAPAAETDASASFPAPAEHQQSLADGEPEGAALADVPET